MTICVKTVKLRPSKNGEGNTPVLHHLCQFLFLGNTLGFHHPWQQFTRCSPLKLMKRHMKKGRILSAKRTKGHVVAPWHRSDTPKTDLETGCEFLETREFHGAFFPEQICEGRDTKASCFAELSAPGSEVAKAPAV